MSLPGPVQIIGIGSPCGDDRAGWEVIRRLEQRLPPGHGLQLIALDRPGSGLIPLLQQDSRCWLVDALRSDRPGQHLRPRPGQLVSDPGTVASSHSPGLAASLRLAEVLGLLPRELELHCISITAADPLADTLSPPVEAAVDRLVEYCCQRLEA